MSARPRQLVFRGRVEASALLATDTPRLRAQILAGWKPGTLLTATPAGLLIRLGAPEAVDCEASPGLPLVEHKGTLLGLPLTDGELDSLGVAPASMVVARSGEVQVASSGGTPLDPSAWVDISAFHAEPATSLAPPPRPLSAALAAPAARSISADGAAALLGALRTTGAVPPPSLGKRLMRWLYQRLTRPQKQTALPPSAPGAPRRPWYSRMADWVSERIARTRFSKWLDSQQQRYLDRLQKMFDENELDLALKHALPLKNTPGNGPPRPPSLLPPGPRDRITVSAQSSVGTSTQMTIAANQFDALRAQYRAAAKKLEEDGRLEEAAFVLADLLDVPIEAVTMLEKHKRFRLAAELAEGRNLEAELCVRLWFLAGETERAVLLARRKGCMAGALARLERGNPVEALNLRLLWAESLAASGDFAAAVEALRKVPEAQRLVLKWVDLGIAAGGQAAIPLRVQRLDLKPEEPDALLEFAHTLFRDDSAELAKERTRLALALSAGETGSLPTRMALGREAVRALVRDRAAHGTDNAAALQALLARDDGALRTDVPARLVPPPPRQAPGRIVFAADPVALPARDAVLLPEGRVLVALGEHGVRLLASSGKTLWHCDTPAFSLAHSPDGALALALTPRGTRTQLEELSLASRTSRPVCGLETGPSANSYDEGAWFFSEPGQLVGLDLLSSPPTALWRAGELGGRVISMATDDRQACLLLENTMLELRLLQFTLPGLIRQPLGNVTPAGTVLFSAVHPAGHFALTGHSATSTQPRLWVRANTAGTVEVPLPGRPMGPPAITQSFAAVPVEAAGGGIDVVLWPGNTVLRFEQAARVALRFQDGVLTCAGDNGRVVSFDTGSMQVVRQVSAKVRG